MRVLSYNIKGWRGDLAALLETVRDQAPDVLVLQEVLRWSDPRTWCIDLAARFGMDRAVGGLPAYGNAIVTASDVTVLGSRVRRYPPALGDSRRAAVFVRGVFGGVEFVAAGTHLATDPRIRLRQAPSFKRQLNAADAPVVAGVDVNETDAGPAWQTIADGLVGGPRPVRPASRRSPPATRTAASTGSSPTRSCRWRPTGWSTHRPPGAPATTSRSWARSQCNIFV